jgi:hypothetical protein
MTSPLPTMSPATLRGAKQFDLASKIAGRSYRIYLSRPATPPPEAGYPVVVVTDGDGLFSTAAVQMAMGQFGELRPAAIVGIGYPGEDLRASMVDRTRDLTPPTPMDKIPATIRTGLYEGASFGGADPFLGFITEELLPALGAETPLDPADRTLFGDSLGGLFVLHALFNQPTAFRTYVAASPSIWWNERDVLNGEAAFVGRVEAGEAAPRVLVTIGGLEQNVPSFTPPGQTREEFEAQIVQARMVDNARELGQRLAAIKGSDGYLARFQLFEDETHLSVIPAAISRGLTFALGA